MASIRSVRTKLNRAFRENSEVQLLDLLRKNSFLFYNLFHRKGAIQPIFHEVSFGGDYRCDFAWLNDNSDGPEWVLVEIEKPEMRLFNRNGKPTAELNAAIEQVKSWARYFEQNQGEKGRIFGAVKSFRLVLVTGRKAAWEEEAAMKWRASENNSKILEIRSMDVFDRALSMYRSHPDDFWSFDEHPVTLPPSRLTAYWTGYDYMDRMRKLFRH